VKPANYHWELFIIKRPDEQVPGPLLSEGASALQTVLSDEQPFTIFYQGFLVVSDGTVIARGYGQFDDLRARLRARMPFASRTQSELGHISLGRILDPMGPARFAALGQLVTRSRNEVYGELIVDEVKYVHEHQWYMEDKDVVVTFPLGGRPKMKA